ncbi:cilia- and flagella-associated protein 99-like [Sycon ciliatum]|uniref:cilia- and flagella-associated protein 99-like n=1 Tax=Sycon ciliatum TaxID=27933 RepID=UPI0031F5F8F7
MSLSGKCTTSPATCLRICTDVAATFERQTPVERDMEKVLSDQLALSQLSSAERSIVHGCGKFYERHRPAMNAVVDTFYTLEAGRLASRADYFMYIALLAIVLDHCGKTSFEYFQKIVATTRPYKTMKFLAEIFLMGDDENWLESVLCRHFDEQYVAESLMPALEEWKTSGQGVAKKMQEEQDRSHKSVHHSTKATVPTKPEPFNLTQPRPRPTMVADQYEKRSYCNPVPASTHATKFVLVNAKSKGIAGAQEGAFRVKTSVGSDLHRPAKQSSTTKDVGKSSARDVRKNGKAGGNIGRVAEASSQSKPKEGWTNVTTRDVPANFKAQKIPNLNPEHPVKSTAASIMRSGALAMRREKEQAKKFADLAAGGVDDEGFQRLMMEKEAQELHQRLTDIEKKHLEGLLSFEQAVIAQETLKLDRHHLADTLKAESEELLHQMALKRMEEEEEMRRIVDTILEGHEHAREARVKLEQDNKEVVKKFSQENEELLQKAKEEAEAERKRRVDLIMQIRAMESVPVERFKEFDRLTSGDHGLLIEMSVAGLQERLGELKLVAQHEEEQRRHTIKEDKEKKTAMLKETEQAAIMHLEEYNRAENYRKQQRKALRKKAAEINDDGVSSLQQQLEQRRRQKERLRDEVKAVSVQSRNRGSKLADLPDTEQAPQPLALNTSSVRRPTSLGASQQRIGSNSSWARSSSAVELTREASTGHVANHALATHTDLFPTSQSKAGLTRDRGQRRDQTQALQPPARPLATKRLSSYKVR